MSKKCTNCGQFKIGSASSYIWILTILCTVFIITLPVVPFLMLFAIALSIQGNRMCSNCNKVYTRTEYKNLTE